MGNIKVVLWDIDGTLLNFQAAEKAAINKCFEIHGLGTCTDEMLAILKLTTDIGKNWSEVK